MLEKSFLKSENFLGVTGRQSTLKPKGLFARKPLVFTLTLTSLIDAFVIMVIYLLVNFGNPNQNLNIPGGIQLPQAVQNSEMESGTVVSIRDGHYFVDEQERTLKDITEILVSKYQAKENDPHRGSLIIEADKSTDYALLSPVILAGAQAGFHDFKFAVLPAAGVKR